MKKILVVDDEPKLASGLKFNLEAEGFEVDVALRAEDAIGSFTRYEMMILDLMLPGMSGMELLRKIREIDYRFPVLILSARTAEEDLLEGLAAGADDYITKPFSLPELILRVRRMIERSGWNSDPSEKADPYVFDRYWINFANSEAMTNNGRLRLTRYECGIMRYLIQKKGRMVSREELLEKVWGYSKGIETRTVEIFIARLRKLFEGEPRKPLHIKSARGVGYSFSD